MITIIMRCGEIFAYTDESYSDYMLKDNFFVVCNGARWIGMYNKNDILAVEVK